MAQCVGIDSNGFVVEVAAAASAPCTTAVILTPTEYAAWADVPWNLSVEDGQALGGAILMVWATAWCFKAMRMAVGKLNEKDEE